MVDEAVRNVHELLSEHQVREWGFGNGGEKVDI